METKHFGMGAIAYNLKTKEYVRVTNGKCVLDHSTTEGFRASHPENMTCEYAAHEAIAIRVLPTSGLPIMGFSYIGVNESDLHSASDKESEGFESLLSLIQATAETNNRRRVNYETIHVIGHGRL